MGGGGIEQTNSRGAAEIGDIIGRPRGYPLGSNLGDAPDAPGVFAVRSSDYAAPVCTENLNPNVMVMKFAKDRLRFDASGPLNRARDRRIFVQ